MRLLVLLSVLAGVACIDAVLPAPPSLAGSYELEAVNDGELPALIAVIPPELIRLTKAVVVIRADSTFTDSTWVHYDRQPFGGQETELSVRHGRWTPGEYEWRGDTLVRFEARRLPMGDLTLKYVRH